MIVELGSIALAVVLYLGASAKLADRAAGHRAIVAFGVPARAAGALGWALIGSELAIGTALLFGPTRVAGAAGALALLALLSAAVAANLTRGRRPECHCFGRLSSGPIGPSTLARNGLLAAAAAYLVTDGREPALFAGLAIVCGAACVWLGRQRPRIGRGAPAPGFSVGGGAGTSWTLQRLLADGRPVLLVFSQPTCGACQALLGDLRQWRLTLGDRLTIAVVDETAEAGARSRPPEEPGHAVLLDPAGTVAKAYGVTATPSAVLIETSGRMASEMARGFAEIDQLVRDRFAQDDPSRFARRTLIVRAARGATTLGAFPLLAAACGSSSRSTSSTAASAAPPASVRVGSAYICRQRYALCTNAPCRASAHDPNVVICDCVVEGGYSVGLTSCPRRAPHGSVIYSTFSTSIASSSKGAMSCPADVPWANCVDAICELDPNDPNKATCQCPLVKRGPSFTLGGDCNTGTCGKTVWSGAHQNLGGSQVAAEMKRLGQPLALPAPCPRS